MARSTEGCSRDSPHSQNGDRSEPHHHNPAEHRAYPGGAPTLEEKECHQNRRGDERHYPAPQGGGRDLDTLHGAQYRDGWGDHSIAVEQGSAQETQAYEEPPASRRIPAGVQQCEQRHNAALAPVVRPHDEAEILEGDHEVERPEDQRQDAENVFPRRGQSVFRREAGLEGI